MLTLFLAWIGLLAALIVFCLRDWRLGGALVLGYFLSLSLIHVPGVLPYIVSDFLPGADETQRGFLLTVIGLGAFVAGAAASRVVQKKVEPVVVGPPIEVIDRFSVRCVAFGLLSYFVLLPIAGRVGSLTALVSPLGTLVVIGMWLRFYAAAQRGQLRKAAQSLLLLPLLPLATLGTDGFIGYGVNWVICVIAFFFVISRVRLLFYALAPVVVFLGLSFFVAYMGERTGIREMVWYEHAGVSDRMERISEIFTHFEPLDLTSDKHIAAIDGRLNQNFLVGEGMQRHGAGESPFLYGGTIPVWIVVPRALWPDKPDVGGGGDIVSKFTGQTFAEGTSVGAGQVLEFYMNFGYPGVIIGFAVLGFALMRLDRGIMDGLRRGDLRLVLRCAMPGLGLIQPGGNLTEIAVVTLASIPTAYILTSFKVFGVPAPRTRSAPV